MHSKNTAGGNNGCEAEIVRFKVKACPVHLSSMGKLFHYKIGSSQIRVIKVKDQLRL